MAAALFGFDTPLLTAHCSFCGKSSGSATFRPEIAPGSILVGCLFGAGAAGSLTDHFGRKRILLAAAALFGLSSVGAAVHATSGNSCLPGWLPV
jgi:SP family arabinose:H+ symporter-like MFS transporter